jgi:hypothetical protein
VAVARERDVELAEELAPAAAPSRGVPLVVHVSVLVVELAWLAALGVLAFVLVSRL